MAFFDELGQMIGSKSKDAAAKVKDISSVIQLKSKVSAEMETRKNAFTRIGEKIFEEHAAVFEEEFHTEFQTIREASKRIQDLTAQISELEGTRVCPECGAKVLKGAKFCSSCGAPMDNTAKTEPEPARAEDAKADEPSEKPEGSAEDAEGKETSAVADPEAESPAEDEPETDVTADAETHEE